MKKNAVLGMMIIMTLLLNTCHSVRDTTKKTYSTILENLDRPRPSGQSNVLKLTTDPIPVVRIGFIGIGNRGYAAICRYVNIEDVEIKALCDLEKEKVKRAQQFLAEKKFPPAQEYVGEEAWKKVCRRNDIDLIYICTDWLDHTSIAVYAMEQGKHVAIEVPAATTIDECWQLVDTAEKMRRHLISGTKGVAQKYPVERIALDPEPHQFMDKEKFDQLMKRYEHPFIKEIGAVAKRVGGHGGMDYIMDYRLIYCLKNGLPLDQDVYDAVEWSSLVELTKISVRNGGIPVRIPDFTRGDWNKLNGLTFAH